jgi:pimeloyl-ACP methyl ester carboxylesterase
MQCQLPKITVHYEMMGEGRPFITISGARGDCSIFSSWMEPIFEKRPGWRRFYMDLPGAGRTPGADWITGSDQMVDVICDFIDAVIPGQAFTLMAGSLGGIYARGVVYHKAALCEGLCLLAPWLGDVPDEELPQPEAFVKDPAILAQLEPEDAEFFEEVMVLQTQKLLDWYLGVVKPARSGGDPAFLRRVVQEYQFSYDVDARPFDKPTLILTGRYDTHVGYRSAWEVLETYPRATYVVLDRAGHALGVEQEGLFRALVNEWLDRVEEHTTTVSL